MRKLSRWILVALCIVTAMVFVCACNTTENDDSYKVTFNLGYRNAPTAAVVKVESGEKVAKPADPTRENYAFDAWYKEIACINEYDFDSEVVRSFTLFAGWKQTSFTVTYSGEGIDVNSETVSTGEKFTQPENPTREGYVFSGWYTNPLCGAEYKYDFDSTATGDITLYAGWDQTAAIVTLYGEGTTVFKTVPVDIGKKLDPEALGTPTRGNKYAFTAWYTNAQRTALYDFDNVLDGDLNLYAGWEQVMATLTYNLNYPNAPTPDTQDVETKVALDKADLLDPESYREGYAFVDWYSDSACTTKFVYGGGVTEDIVLYAAWTIKTYTVTFNWNYDGAPAAVELEVDHGSKAKAPTPLSYNNVNNDGKVVVGWTTDPAGQNAFDLSSTIKQSGIVLYAKWETQTEIVFTFYNDGAVFETRRGLHSGDYLDEPTGLAAKPGYYFGGWVKTSDGDVWDFRTDKIYISETLTALWLKGYTFEAEYTELEGKYYSGWSNDGFGPASNVISDANNYSNPNEIKASGGFYVYSMLYNGAYLEFHVTSSAAVDNAVLVLRLSPDGFSFELDDESYLVIVNGVKLDYGTLCIPIGSYRTDDMSDQRKPPFFNYLLTLELSLNAGDNIIRLETNNQNEHGGTFAAETPSVDCITIYSSSVLSWTEGHCFAQFNLAELGVENVTVDYAVNYEGNFRITYLDEHYDTEVFSLARLDVIIPKKKED